MLLKKWLFFFIVFASIVLACIVLLWLDTRLYNKNGYSFLAPRPNAPFSTSCHVFDNMYDVYVKSFKSRDVNDYNLPKWPTAKILADQMSGVIFSNNQPYSDFGIFILVTKIDGNRFLYSPDRYQYEVKQLPKVHGSLLSIIACVMADREVDTGHYEPYHDYPLKLKKEIGFDAWKTWYFIGVDGQGDQFCYYVKSDIPPIPGCLVYTGAEVDPNNQKVYYPREILPVLKAIYSNLEVPKEAILD
jgi:hypothetical protein